MSRPDPGRDDRRVTRILVVDDNATNRKLLVTLLSSEGYLLSEAVDGSDGLVVARRERPDLVISDILMPSMDGYEFVRRLRLEPQLARVAVIFYTATYHEREALALAERCGALRVLLKPCPLPDLLAAVEQALTRERPPAQTPAAEQFDAEHLRLLTDKLSQKADELHAANAQLSALITLNVQLASEPDPYQLLRQVCDGGRNLVGARYAVLAVQKNTDDGTVMHCQSGLELGKDDDAPDVSLTQGLLGSVFTQRRPRRLVSPDDTALDVGLPAAYPAARALLAVPISSLSRTYGWLCLADKVGADGFTSHDEHLMAILAAQVGRIYENGSLYHDLQDRAAQLLVEMEERERAAAQLRESEERFRQLAENIQDVFFVQTADRSLTVYVSPAYERIWGRPMQDLLQDPLAWTAAVHPDDRERVLAAESAIVGAFPNPGSTQYRIVRPDGEVRWIVTRTYPVIDERGKTTRVVGVSTDITGRKTAEDKVLKLNRVYAMLSGVNSLIVRVLDRGELLQEVCRLAVEHGGFKAAWCGLVDRSTAQLTQTAFAGSLSSDAHSERSPWADVAEHPLVSAAMQSRQATACDQSEDQDAAGRLPSRGLLAGGCRALAALPLVINDRPVGCIVLISSETGVFDAAEMRLLSELRGDISFALDHIAKAESLNHLAYYDALTGLANRTLLQERLAQHLHALPDAPGLCALMVADIEGFDTLNEMLGRAGGDELLRSIAGRLVDCVGDSSFVARCGSDEFAAVISRPSSVIDITRTVEKWLKEWLSAPFEVAGKRAAVRVKAGIAVFPEDGTDAASLLRRAELALKKAKTADAQYAVYTSQLGKTLLERRELESELRRALDREEFVLHYQPKVDLAERRLTGAEALMRWLHPEHGIIPPARFIPIMEENGLIVEAGAWALRQASLDRSRWLERSLPAPRVAVNVSSAQLRREDFVRTVATIVKLAGGQAGIDLEVTETLLMEDIINNIEKLSRLRELGVEIALDDFGTGYSSLAYLAKLPVETLKIDRSFVIAMLDDPSAMTLVSTVISLAHALKLKTIAEGVESEEQAKFLRLLRCDQMQGFLVSEPLPFQAMSTYLARARV